MSITVTATADPSQPNEVAAAATAAITQNIAIAAAAERLVSPTGPLREMSWRSGRLDAGDLLARLAALPDSAPVMTGDELLVDTAYDGGTLHLHTVHTAPPAPGSELRRAVPASVWRSARTRLLTVGDLRERLADVPDSAPVTVGGDPLMDADYVGVLELYTPYTGDLAPDPDDEDDENEDEDEDED